MQPGALPPDTTVGVDPVALLTALGLRERITIRPKLDERLIAALAERHAGFEWIDMGTTELPLGRLIAAVRSAAPLSPPRSGHLGNWSDIALGRAGMLDYNRVICLELGLGHPLIYPFTQVETEGGGGDRIYLPGSLVDGGRRRPLRLFSWSAASRQWVERARSEPLLTPFVAAEVDGGLVPLARLHVDRMRALDAFAFRFDAELVQAKRETVRRMLTALVEGAKLASSPRRAFIETIDRAVGLDGRVRRDVVLPAERGYRVGEATCSLEQLIDAAMIPFLAASEPERFMELLPELPAQLPLVSNLTTNLLAAFLNAHYPSGATPPATKPFNPHLHWGALGMAGYPPAKRGYFKQKIRHARRMSLTLVKALPELDPLFFVLMPVAPFTLWPSSAFPDDLPAVESLLAAVRAASDPLRGKLPLMRGVVERVVEEWLATNLDRLSPYYVGRFAKQRTVHASDIPQEGGVGLEPEGFAGLTIRQATVTVGALLRSLGAAA